MISLAAERVKMPFTTRSGIFNSKNVLSQGHLGKDSEKTEEVVH